MDIEFNNTAIKMLIRGNYNPEIPNTQVEEIALLPDRTNLSAIASVLQQGSTLRKRISGKAYVESLSDYQTLRGYWESGTTGTYDDGEVNATYMIAFMSGAEKYQGTIMDLQGHYEFDISFVEV